MLRNYVVDIDVQISPATVESYREDVEANDPMQACKLGFRQFLARRDRSIQLGVKAKVTAYEKRFSYQMHSVLDVVEAERLDPPKQISLSPL